ncbi:D-glycero-beta-D-manno-heptose-7-phosphate kinase [Campylobacter lari]|uniref:D-glycero-beta-D-manno-heptose-7-phosphate kinase n=1 Tax=Campylobacter sp. CNRCH_2014_2452 TaxID=2911603 RepID=UPI001288368D|nr:D-glycero-beta-D-manno-heptose-7-phosphate kinase [Campylobacter sp. CNRCH_2014_2452]EAK0818916.1 D-glycero-beta-D-manno-heptose-7-phosphate kinase [Campylobacter lari]EAK9891396.1 D-glycero-beta-D-manno-heptose-7-phosphate kinase [Campylobacter lari]EGK8026096.1 D-glycero-beta-D-manno-heptose-7-phosphate kinase [Campylobacter lari]EGK8128955.1 D-glycero-beta-D-manno-heptose-7-phosphate kinase [Campylobacter lari]MCV3486371.1 D-glycero-beta-D-manno-heptose-7-phosphate kinase [Campylobacter 
MFDFLSSKKPKILVVGDFMVDHYIWCDCTRISPEAPVMVMKSQKEDKRLGGAGNVYANLKSLGAEVFALGLVGDDESGRFLKENLNAKLLVEKDRKTPLKSRVLSHSQQVLRLDDENDFDTKLEDEIIQEYKTIAKDYDAIVLSDYAKGILTSKVTKALIEHANTLNLPILIDPKGSDFSKYQNATLLTPNKKEAIQALGVEKIDNLEKALKKLKDDLNLAYSIITLSEEGIALFDEKLHIIPAKALEVYDVTGAGDSVIAMLAYALALKVDIVKACELANDAAAVVVAKVGSVSVSLEEIKNLKKASFEDKIKSKEELVKLIQNQKVVFTNGCFDIMHYGHIKYLEKAKKLGDILVVGLNSDESVKKLKGNSRPINLEFQRACMLASMYFVDYVVIFNDDTPYELIEFLKPDVLVKGADYKGKEVVGSNLVKKVELIDFEDGFSTTNIINRIANDK